MPFYEITYETGRSSIASYADDAEAESAVAAHHARAMNGLPGGPVAGHPTGQEGNPNWSAERIAKVRVYDKHPDDLNPDQTLSVEVAEKQLSMLIKGLADENGVVNVARLSAEVRGLTHPMVTVKESPFDSNFRMKEKKELDMAFLEASN